MALFGGCAGAQRKRQEKQSGARTHEVSIIAEQKTPRCCTICLNMTPENAAAVDPQPAGMGEFSRAVDPQPAGMGEFSRIVGVFFEPKKTFADIALRPSWLIPMILLI